VIPHTIIVPLDGSEFSERAVPVATELAAQLHAEVILARTTYGDVRYATSYLNHLAQLAGDESIEVLVLADFDTPRAIALAVQGRRSPIICMTTHGRGRLRWTLQGSVAEEVITQSAEPVLLVGPNAESAWNRTERRVIVCVDGTTADGAAVSTACEWAKALDLEVHIVCGFHPLDLAADHPESVFGPLEDIAHAAGLRVQVHQIFQSSFMAGALVDLAKDEKATLLVMGAHHKGAVARIALGSTTMAAVHLAPCPVLVMPPDERPSEST
jgi:nucleotide-binding universal stress UspA family protein